jgi:prefoldin alpha subunit
MASSEGGNAINIDTMSLDQLNQIKTSQESRLEQLTAQYHQLRAVSARLSTARASVNEAFDTSSSNNEGRQIMIPLTESLYAPGKMVDANKILVELGAGFFVEKSSKDAIKVLERKQKIVDANSENVLAAAEASSRNVEAIKGAMQGKLLEIQARQQGRAFRNKAEGGE